MKPEPTIEIDGKETDAPFHDFGSFVKKLKFKYSTEVILLF